MTQDEIIFNEIATMKGYLDLLEKELRKHKDLGDKMEHLKPLSNIIYNSYQDLKTHGRPNYNYQELLNNNNNNN